MNTITNIPPLGSVSHGTMRTQDLLPTFLDTLEEIHGATWSAALFGPDTDWDFLALAEPDPDRGPAFLVSGRYWPEEDAPWWNSDEASDLMERTFDALQESALPYCYFGAHEGDGSDFGFWPSIDAAEDDVDVLRVNEVPEFILHTNDHGNVTLYRITVEEVWSAV